MKTKYLMLAVGIMIIAQLFVPISMIVNRFDTLNNGVEYKFKVQPVDPYDAFRGRYVAIHVDGGKFDSQQNRKVIYAILGTDENGFSYVEKISEKKPNTNNYIKAKSRYGRVQLPFERYYMEEKLAPKAEKAYNQDRKDAYIKVRVKNGNTVIEGLYINDIRIEDYVKREDI